MTRLTAHAYTVAWLCALPLSELVVATAMLDEEHDPVSLPTYDDNSYTYGSINGHNVVVACMPPGLPGKVSACKLVQPLGQTFPNLKIHLFVGVGGGVPRIPPTDNPDDDIHLGDVVIGWAEEAGVPGVVQWDLAKYLDGNTEPLGILDKPDRRLLNALGLVLRNRILGRTRFPEHLERLQNLAGFSHPGLEHDKLFKSTHPHVRGPNCSFCDPAQLTERLPRLKQDLIFHQGTIVSGDTIMKDPQRRNEISQRYHGALCFEMEAAGVMDDKRCLVIRGIADYADSHIDGSWQNYAAGTAAAFAREFLFTLQPQVVYEMESAASLNSIPTALADDQKACLQSLSFPEIDFRKNDVADPINKTCGWLLKHAVYLRWLGEHRGLLWLKGKPGAGKSTLMRYALKQQKVQHRVIVVSFFFHGRGASIQKSLLGFFRSLLFQILQHIPDSLSSFSELFRRKCDTQGKVEEKWEWQASELQDHFKTYITNAIKTHSVQIFVDALDECGEEIAIDLVDFFRRLMDELPHTKASFRICFSCRHYPLVALDNGLEIYTEDENREDIEIYVRNKLENAIQDKIMSEKLQADIIQRSLNVFQWVVLVVPRVILLHKKGKSLLSIQKALYQIPAKLNELYQELLRGIEDNEKSQCLQLMQWICFALRPLSLKELRFAIAVDADTPHDSLSKCQAAEEYANTDEEMEKRINDLSKGLAEVKLHDYQYVAQFVHQSVSDYLIQGGGLNILTNKTIPDDVIGSAHFRLSRSCISYMNMKEIVGFQQDRWNSIRLEFPFLQYAVTSWIAHAEVVEKKNLSQVDLLDLFDWPSGENFRAWIQIYKTLDGSSDRCPNLKQTFLHIASIYGFCDVVSAILDTEDAEPNSKDGFGRTPVSVAAENGNEAVVKLLLSQKDIAPNLADDSGCTPLHYAAICGHVEIIKMLLARNDINSSLVDRNDETPLCLAANYGHVDVVKLLLAQEDIAPTLSACPGRTPLHGAAGGGHVEVVKLLLARKDVNPNSTDIMEYTPLHTAVNCGHVEVVKLLLAREYVNPNSTDNLDNSPLHIAVISGYAQVVKLLLARQDVDLNSRDYLGSTPLHNAVSRRAIELVKLLLARKDINPDLTDNSGRTPLREASNSGHVEIVKLLLARKDVNPNFTDEMESMLLQRAVRCWNEEIIKLLLVRNEIDPNLTDERRKTLLHEASKRGRVEVVELMLARKDVNPTSTDVSGRTPLHEASNSGHFEIVKLLLARKDVNPNLTDDNGSTPLHEASMHGRVEVVELLLARKDVDPNLAHSSGSTPLHKALRCGEFKIVELLLARKDVNPNSTDNIGWTPLREASRYGRVKVVELLLARKDINLNSTDVSGSTPLHEASIYGRVEVVELLLARKDVDPNLAHNIGWTPLREASRYGRVKVVELLLARKDINPNSTDNSGRTPLHEASRYGRVEIVELLLARKDVNPDPVDDFGWTPLYDASNYGKFKVVELLLARKDVNPNSTADFGSTPLHKALRCGEFKIVELLLARKDVNPNSTDDCGSTPLHIASSFGEFKAVELLLARKDINLNSTDVSGSTPLHEASIYGRVEVVELLLARKDVDPNLAHNIGWTPLREASRYGRVKVVELLLARKDINPNSTDNSGRTPLHEASRYGRVEIVELLLARKDVNPDPVDDFGWTPLHDISECGELQIAELLLARKYMDPNSTDNSGSTPLHEASRHGRVEVVELLLARKDVDPNLTDHSGSTPLHEASKRGRLEVVELLLARKDIEIPSEIQSPSDSAPFPEKRLYEKTMELFDSARFQQQQKRLSM